jgi:hypothetical protein
MDKTEKKGFVLYERCPKSKYCTSWLGQSFSHSCMVSQEKNPDALEMLTENKNSCALTQSTKL